MDEEPKMTNLPAKLTALFAAGAVLSFGLCTAGVITGAGGDNWFGEFPAYASVGFIGCLVGLACSALWWAIAAGRSDDE